MKASSFLQKEALKSQQGTSTLVVLLVVGIVVLVAFQVSSIVQNQIRQSPNIQNQKLAQPPSTKQENVKVSALDDIKIRSENVKKYLVAEAALLGVTDNISLYFKDMKNDSIVVSLDPSKSWIPASTIKSYVLLEAFRQARLGLINFNTPVTIAAGNVVPTELETDEFPRLREGTRVTIRQLVEAMVIQSDNTAYNSLLDILDRRNINASLRNFGITETVVGEKLNLDAGQFQQDLQVAGRQPNTTTVKDLSAYFSLLYTHEVPDAEAILSIFKRQKINNMIPARLPDNTVIAHKTGDWAPIYHDGGIVYKPTDPFVFVVFTNSGDPAIVAKLAQVAYFQDAKYVGKALSYQTPLNKNLALGSRPRYYDNGSSQVLGEQTTTKFPDVTAEDLGITSKDLVPDSRQVNNVKSALVTPGSALYGLKKVFEGGQLELSFSSSQKARTYLGIAGSRLSEIKSLLSGGDMERVDQILSEAVEDIKNATELTKDAPDKDRLLIEIKKTNDLYYAVMADIAVNLPDDKKLQFVDSVYNFYQKGKAEIAPIINSSVIVNPTQQRPTIGVIEKVSSDQVTLKFDDGSSKQVNLSSGTNVRSVDQDVSENIDTLKVGNKIAVLGPIGASDTVNAQFILNNIPRGLTDQHQGTVTEVNPNDNTIKVIDQKGQVNLVRVEDSTTVKSRDTDVSLEGIKAGSQVVIFGVPVEGGGANPISALKSSSQSGNINNVGQDSLERVIQQTPTPVQGQNTKSSNQGPAATGRPGSSDSTNTSLSNSGSSTVKPVIEIKATSVTVVGNSSGKKEQKQPAPPKNETKPNSSHPSSLPVPTVVPKSSPSEEKK